MQRCDLRTISTSAGSHLLSAPWRLAVRRAWLVAGLVLFGAPAAAQTELQRITVTAPPPSKVSGGYLRSGDFKVDPRMPYVVFAAEPLIAGDILTVQPMHLNDDEYLVLQECASADCSVAKLVRVWSVEGSTSSNSKPDHIWIKRENKYFLWLKRLPGFISPPCEGCGTHYSSFALESPPLVLEPNGTLTAFNTARLEAAKSADPILVKSQRHDGTYFNVTYAGGTRIRVQRMRALSAEQAKAEKDNTSPSATP